MRNPNPRTVCALAVVAFAALAPIPPTLASPLSFDLVFGDRSGPTGALGSTNIAPILLGNSDSIFDPRFGEFHGAPYEFPEGPGVFGAVTSVSPLEHRPSSEWYGRTVQGDYYRGPELIGTFSVVWSFRLQVDSKDPEDPQDDVVLNLSKGPAPLYPADFPDYVAGYNSLRGMDFPALVRFSFNDKAPPGFENSEHGYATRIRSCWDESPVSCAGFQVFHNFEFSFSQPVDRFTMHGVELPLGIPEPGSLALLGLGFAGLGLTRRRRLRDDKTVLMHRHEWGFR